MVFTTSFSVVAALHSGCCYSVSHICDPVDYCIPGFPVLHHLLELAQTHAYPTTSSSVIPFSSCLQSFQASGSFLMSRLFTSGGLKYWSVNFSISPSNEYSEFISFRINCFDLLAVQRTLKSLLQHHSSKASVFQCSAFFIVQLSHPLEKEMATHSNILAWRIP